MDSMLRAGRVVVWVGLALMLATAACADVPDGAGADAGQGGQDAGQDAGTAQSGLIVQWMDPFSLPGAAGNVIYLDEVKMPLRDVRAIGDAAPGDSRTYVSTCDLHWEHGQAPPWLSFPSAPPGLYSRFEFRIQSAQGDGYELSGELVLPGHDHRVKFTIEDKQMLPVSIPLNVSLEPGQVRTIMVKIDIIKVLAAIDWSDVEIEDDTITIDEESPEIAVIRAALEGAISVEP